MSIVGVSLSLRRLLENQYRLRYPGEEIPEFRVFNTSQLTQNVTNQPTQVTLFLYRVEVDPTRRHIELSPSSAVKGQSGPRFALGLDLRYLLTVWAQTAEIEQQVLGECIEILDEHAVFGGGFLDDNYPWPEGAALKINMDSLSNEDLLRLWDSLEPSYHLSVPYLVRTVRMRENEQPTTRLVESRANVWIPAVSQ